MRQNKVLIIWLLILILMILIFDELGYAVDNLSFDFIWEAKSPRLSIPVGEAAMPMIVNDLIYMTFFSSGNAGREHTLKVYDLKTGQLLGCLENKGAFNSIGPVSNGKEVVFVNEEEHRIDKLNGIISTWSRKFDDYIWTVALDDTFIYVKTSNELIYMDFGSDNEEIPNEVSQQLKDLAVELDIDISDYLLSNNVK